MSVYAIWNNKGGVGKSYLTFQIASEYARVHPEQKVLVIDLCPQANASSMLLGGMVEGERALEQLALHTTPQRKTISGYIEERILSPYVNPKVGSQYLTPICEFNAHIPDNLYLLVGDEQLEAQGAKVFGATQPGPDKAWSLVHFWIRDLIQDVKTAWQQPAVTVFIDCNPSFSIYTELALSAADRLIIPFSADGSSKRAVRAVLALIYGVNRYKGMQRSEFSVNAEAYGMSLPSIYCYVGNRLTQYVNSATAFETVVSEIGQEIWQVWRTHKNRFYLHPADADLPDNEAKFRNMFQFEIRDANTASVASSALGIPLAALTSGQKDILGKSVTINKSQLDELIPNMQALVENIE